MNREYSVEDGYELNDDELSLLMCSEKLISVAGFGSLLSETSARSTFPDLKNFRVAKIKGYRRVFAHTCSIFFERGIAKPDTKEIASLSVEPHADSEIVVTVFEMPANRGDSISAFIEREHEFRFLATYPEPLSDLPNDSLEWAPRPAVVCAANTDENYRLKRCDEEEWKKRYGKHGLRSLWNYDDILPCRVYLRHVFLAARRLGSIVESSFLDGTVLCDRKTTVREYLERNPDILDEEPPPSLVGRYSG